jgi:hypothetical protein
MPREEKLESRLVKESWVNPANFLKAKDEQAKSGKSLYSTLIRMGYLSEERVYEFFSQAALIPFVKLSDYKLDPAVIKVFPERSYREHLFLPLLKLDDTVYVCMANPVDSNLISILEAQSSAQVFPMFACPSEIQKAIDTIFGPDDRFFDLEDLIVYPQTIGVMPFWRESDRLSIKLEAEFKLVDERLQLVSSSYVPATICDISSSGKAMGLRTIVFIPPSMKVFLRFPSKAPDYEARAEVMRCNVEKNGKYLAGIRLTEIREDVVASILKDAVK